MTTTLPVLTCEIVSDDEALGAAVDQLLLTNPKLRRYRRRILAAQDRLKAVASDDAWHAYIRVEECTNARLGEVTIRVARWAFEEGVKQRVRQP